MNEQKLYIALVLGTARKDRESQHAAHYVFAHLQKRDNVDAVFVDVREYVTHPQTIPPWEKNDITKPWREIARQADGFIIVSPEYNHGYPGELKLLLDSAYDEYKRKPVALCGVSDGGFGGARLLDHIKPILVELKMIPLRTAVYFSYVDKLFDASGKITDASYSEKVEALIDELVEYIQLTKK